MFKVFLFSSFIFHGLASYVPLIANSGGGDSTQTRYQTNSGQFHYSFDIHSPSFSHNQWEKSNVNNEREGAYSFRDAQGRTRIVRYVADKYGFRPVIQSNEPGLALNSPPANILFENIHSHYLPPPSSQLSPFSYTITSRPLSTSPAILKVVSSKPIVKQPSDPLYLQYSQPISSSVITSSSPIMINSYPMISTAKTPTVLLLPAAPNSYKTSYKGKIVPKIIHPVELVKSPVIKQNKPIKQTKPSYSIKSIPLLHVISPPAKIIKSLPTALPPSPPKTIITNSVAKPLEIITISSKPKGIGKSYQYRWQQTTKYPKSKLIKSKPIFYGSLMNSPILYPYPELYPSPSSIFPYD